MNKPLLFLLIVLSFPVYCISSNVVSPEDTNKTLDKNQRFSIGGSFGGGIPTESYGIISSSNAYNTNSQLLDADPGIHFDLNAEYHIGKHWGILFQYEGNFNKLDNSYFTYQWRGDPGTSLTGSGGEYYLDMYLPGFFYSHVINENEGIFQFSMGLGYAALHQSAINETYTSLLPPNSVSVSSDEIPSKLFPGFGAEAKIMLKFHLVRKVYFTIDLGYAQFIVSSPNGPYSSILVSYPIGILNGEAGFDF